jgi:hypothetical protein
MRPSYCFAAVALATGALASCSQEPPPPRPVETEVPEEFRQSGAAPAVPAGASIGTPMTDRTATVGLLNKRNNIAQDLTMKPGETRRIGDVIIALKACERTAPWEMPQETGAFVQVFVQQSGNDQAPFGRVFSGWLFKESPSLNVVEHPIYDVWVKDCAMRFPGEEAATGDGADTPARPATPRTPAPAAAPPPPSPAPTEGAANEDIA